MEILLFLIIFPFVAALLVAAVPGPRSRAAVIIVSTLAIAGASLSLLFTHFSLENTHFGPKPETAGTIMLAAEAALGAYIFYLGVRARRILVALLAVLQVGLMAAAEVLYGHNVVSEHLFASDKLSVIMALIVGLVGGLIGLYSIGYMRAYHAHHGEFKDRRRFFFFVQFLFLSSMFGVLFANNLVLLHFFWEITTLCSFFLIGYNGTEQSRQKAFLALTLNMLGGVAFSGALFFLFATTGTVDLDALIAANKTLSLVPVALLALAGMTKSAQLPFSSWLLGAMVAPTPVSALLHSSTMVKAGVYLVIRLAPVLQGSLPGVMIALIGGITFLAASIIAISQSDGKRVLAYSTVANLGLIVLCGGIGTYESVWAGILLIVFHAVTKGLLFLSMGVFEQKTNSRNIEDMGGLIMSMPRLSIMVQIGIAGMFLAPFGMLVSKWAVLRALVDYNPLLAVFVVFGSSATLFYWVKWMGKLLQITRAHENVEGGVSGYQWLPLYSLAIGTVLLVGFYPVISAQLIEPHVMALYGVVTTISQGNIVIMSIMLGMVALFPTTFVFYGRRVRVVDAYLAGANVESSTQFQGSAGRVTDMEMGSYYLSRIFGEAWLLPAGIITCSAIVLVMLGVSPL
jgi:ech hydrogenase subunit A